MELDRGITGESIEFGLICVFVLYTMWFQYSFFVINSLLSGIGICMLLVFFMKNETIYFDEYRNLKFLFLFLISSLLFSLFFSRYKKISFQWCVRIFKYMIPMISIIDYVKTDERRHRKIMWVFVIAGCLLSVSTFQKGVVNNNQGITLGELNSNVLASYLLLVTYSILILFENAGVIKKCILGFAYGVCALALYNAASRRGAVVFAALSLAYVLIFCIKAEKSKSIQKFLMVVLLLMIALYFASNIPALSENSALFRRLLGQGDVSHSDQLRRKYQSAAFKLFLKSPIWGCGLGAVTKACGVHSHSMYYELLGCTGCVGLFLIVGFLIKNVRSTLDAIKRDRKKTYAVSGYMTIAFIASILLSGIQVTYIYDSFFFLMIGAFVSTINSIYGAMGRRNNSNLRYR